MSNPTSTTEVPPPVPSANPPVGIFSPRVQASLFAAMFAFVGLVGWKTFAPTADPASRPSRLRAVDLNLADPVEIAYLPGIGPERASRIAEFRDEHGPFEGLGDLRKVPGIGPGTIEKIRPHVSLSWPKRDEPIRAAVPPRIVRAAMPDKPAGGEFLDPNRATLSELQTLPGIGPKLAQRIVDERQRKPFLDVSDLRRVHGIGVKTLDKIKPRLRVGDETTVSIQ